MRFFLGVVLGVLVLAAPATALAKDPDATTEPATEITATSAVLHGDLDDLEFNDTYWFSYGTTTAYGSVTPTVTHLSVIKSKASATATIIGLKPGTTYHFRLVARDGNHTDYGANMTFKTLGATNPSVPPLGVLAPTDLGEPEPEGATPPAPELGESVVVGVDQGTVKIRLPGAAGYTELTSADSIPVGTLVDTRQGTVELQTATSGGTQTGSFRGALFEVRQSAAGDGMTELVLRGENFAACRRAGTARARSAAARANRRRPPSRSLWGNDDGGRFRTRGRNSVATVRGTSWVTTDTCAGTRTRVTEGEVVVRDLVRNRNVVVRAGQSYLARSAR